MENMIYTAGLSRKDIIKLVSERLLKLHPEAKVIHRPYRKTDVYRDNAILSTRFVDLSVLYPDAKPGQVAYVSTVLKPDKDYDSIRLTVHGDLKVFADGKEVYDTRNSDEEFGGPELSVRREGLLITFMVRFNNDGFSFEYVPAILPANVLWLKAYRAHVRSVSPLECFENEDGVAISKLYNEGEVFDGEYVYPEVPGRNNEILFNEIFEGEDGEFAYALTYAKSKGKLLVNPYGRAKILVNGKVSGNELSLSEGDEVLVKCAKAEKWGFSYEGNCIGVPLIESARKDKWLTLGCFGERGEIEIKHAPELNIYFDRPYLDSKWRKTFWKLESKNDYLRIYIDSSYFSQWFYALMVGQNGLLSAGNAISNNEYRQYFLESIGTMIQHMDYTLYERERFGEPSILQRGAYLEDLDSIGSFGMNFAEYYRMTGSQTALMCCERLSRAMYENVPRFEDGAYYRPNTRWEDKCGNTMWADDTYMSCPFLVRMGLATGNIRYFEECAANLLGFFKRMFIEEKNIFTHIYFVDVNQKNNVPWGRGNGWVMVALSDFLENAPTSVKGYDKLMALYKRYVDGVCKLQAPSGMWHQVLDRDDSYEETSCTAMFTIGLARGIRNGWLGRDYIEYVEKAYEGLLKNAIDSEGNIHNVCKGSWCSMEVKYYLVLGTTTNDEHGTGIILTMLCELEKLYEKFGNE